MSDYTSRHLIAAHAVILRLQAAGVDIEQIQGKDIIAEALADAERGVLVASPREPQGAPIITNVPIVERGEPIQSDRGLLVPIPGKPGWFSLEPGAKKSPHGACTCSPFQLATREHREDCPSQAAVPQGAQQCSCDSPSPGLHDVACPLNPAPLNR